MTVCYKVRFFSGALFICMLFLTAIPGKTEAIEPDIGMVIRLTGEVTYSQIPSVQNQMKVQTFMKIRKNDRFTLSPHAVVQLIYFSNARKETWTGPGSFRVGDSRSEAVGTGGSPDSPQVISLPTAVVDEVRRVSPLVDPSRLHRSGGVQVRGSSSSQYTKPLQPVELTEDEMEEVNKAKETYNSLIGKVDSGDIMPELYLFSVLADYDQFNEMKRLIGEMRKKQPYNAGIERLDQWLGEQSQ
jgi:hypothetical protein